MTERKPDGLTWESWAERKIREAMEAGDFATGPPSDVVPLDVEKVLANWRQTSRG